MAGHSKWANIKHRKAAQDAKRGKLFTKLIRELTVAAKQGGGNPVDNPRLRVAVDKALGANMTRDTIDRAIKRGAGGDELINMEEITYEGYGAAGTAILVECLTDNKNRTVSEIRHAFTKHSGNLGTTGSVAYLFSRKGQILIETSLPEDDVLELALEAGADDIIKYDKNTFELLTDWASLTTIKDALINKQINVTNAEVIMSASTNVDVTMETADSIIKLIDRLEELDDVQNVYHNANLTKEILENLNL